MTIPKRNLSKIYQGKTNENYPFYLYAMQIANCLNRMKKNFIDTKKGKDNPFSYYSLTGLLFSSKDDLLPTRVLLDWSQLGISNSDDKEKIVTFLNGLK
ncbi:hypothetical protein IJM86_03270 [bacterium]|nr:hypothetical protein [bacterium]